ncbi:hypothetical protein SRHO_G00313900 [Serrasalmus rhombeus]
MARATLPNLRPVGSASSQGTDCSLGMPPMFGTKEKLSGGASSTLGLPVAAAGVRRVRTGSVWSLAPPSSLALLASSQHSAGTVGAIVYRSFHSPVNKPSILSPRPPAARTSQAEGSGPVKP